MKITIWFKPNGTGGADVKRIGPMQCTRVACERGHCRIWLIAGGEPLDYRNADIASFEVVDH